MSRKAQHGNELEPIVYEAEVVEEETPAEPGQDVEVRGRAEVERRPSPDRTMRAARALAVAAFTVGQGWHSWAVRAFDGLTHGVHRRQIRIAETVGDREALAAWVDRKAQAAERRHARLMNLPMLALAVAKFVGLAAAGLVVLLLVVALLVWVTGAGGFTDVFVWFGGVLRWLFGAVAVAWTVFVVSLPVLLVVGGYRAGRRAGASSPQWLSAEQRHHGGGGRGVVPNEGAIVNALKHLGITPLNQAFKAGWRPRFVLATGRDGKGWRTQLELPPGVTVDMINQRKDVLAHNLVRLPVEVWPTEPKNQPGVLDLWVADQGSLTGKVADWPLLEKGTADYFKGVPAAVDIRGNSIKGLLSEKNYAFAGMMGSGKSTMIITLVLGAMLDPLVDIDVFVLATNADFDPMRRRLRTLLTGPGDDVVEACLETMRGLYGDLTIRGQALIEHGERAVNRALAERDTRLRPRILVVDECQALFMHPELGEEAADLTVQLISAARKYGITLMFATPEPSSASLPRRVMAVTSNKACFAIGDQQSNDAILGTGSYKSGISAVSLEPKTEEGPGDIGTCMARGFTPKPGLLRSYYVAGNQVPPIVDRAMKLREEAGVRPAAIAAAVQARDLLEDLAAVMGEEPVPVADLPALLAAHAPAWLPYKTLTGKQLRADLEEMGVKVPTTGNRYPVAPALIRQALAQRQNDDSDAG
ncbi:hypothetical protein ACGFI3_42840 [Nonomuraea wenchangensis]|uniref:hypothetical protein n=1 Tax=Nonomuraea wenchangensis TaxID=568860 RepID=UPI003711E10B